jgi:hypothetical protein
MFNKIMNILLIDNNFDIIKIIKSDVTPIIITNLDKLITDLNKLITDTIDIKKYNRIGLITTNNDIVSYLTSYYNNYTIDLINNDNNLLLLYTNIDIYNDFPNNIEYNTTYISNYSNINIGEYYLLDNSIEINKTNGQITINNLDIGSYNINVYYKIYDIIVSINLKFNITSSIKYTSHNININYGDTFISDIPYIYLLDNGYFILNKLIKNINIDKNTGIITITDLNIGSYTLSIDYKNDNITYSTIVIINVLPKISYETFQILNIGEIGDSCIPLINNKINTDYIFELDNNQYPRNINIDSTLGKIYFNNLNVGIYNISINLKSKANIILNSYIYILTINPIFYYSPNIYSINYGETLSSNKPYIYETGMTNSEMTNSGIITFDSLPDNFSIKDNIIIVNNNANIGNYLLNINYTVNNVTVISKVNIIINPIIKYKDINDINYGVNFTSESPYISHKGGIFSINNNINGIIIDENTGLLYIDNCNIGNYNLQINYKYGELSTFTNININIIPIISYDQTEMYYGTNNYSEIPYISPPITKDSRFNIKNCY